MAIALANQPTIQNRVSAYVAAQQRVAQALSPLLPQVSGLWNRIPEQELREPGHRGSGTERRDSVSDRPRRPSATVTASQLLFDFGKNWAATDAAKATSEFAREGVELQKDLIALAVKQSYYGLLLANRLVVVNAQAVDRADLNLRSAKGFFEVGTRPRFDVTRAEVDVANARVSLIRAQNAVSLSRIALNTGMGIAVNAPDPDRGHPGLRAVPWSTGTRWSPRPSAAARRTARPEYQVDAAEAILATELPQLLPRRHRERDLRRRPGGHSNEIYSYGVQLSWTHLRWRQQGGPATRRPRRCSTRAKANVRDTELTIWQQVEQAYVNLISAEEQIGAAQKAVESAQENFRLSQGRFDAGVGTIIELTDAQLALTQAQSTQAQALTDYRLAIAQLERNLGRR